MNFQLTRLVSLSLAILITLGFQSCRKDAPSDSAETTTLVDPSTLDFKRNDNTVYVNLPLEPNALNPLMTTQGYSRYVWRHIIQALNDIDPGSYAQVPMLAELPDVFQRPDGGVDYTFNILEDAQWPDGSEVTAADVVFSLKILFNPLIKEAGPYRSFYDMIENVSLTPANEKRIKISTSKPYILSEAALGSVAIYPEYAYDPEGLLKKIRLQDLIDPAKAKRLAENNAELKKFAEQFADPAYSRDPDKVIGSGPYKLVSWEAGQKIRLEKRDNYWADNSGQSWMANKPDAIEYQFIKEAATVVNALRDQEFDAVVELGVTQFRELKEEPQTAKYYNFSNPEGFTYYTLMLNNQDPILKDVKVRSALAHLMDVETVIENNYGPLATRVTGPIHPQKDYYHDKLSPIPFDIAKAGDLLKEAGWTDSNGNGTLDKEIDGKLTELSLKLSAFKSEVSQAIALMFQQSAKGAGVDIEIASQDGRTLFGSLDKGEFQIATMGAGSEPIPDDLTQVWSTRSVPPAGSNRMRYGDAESDRLIEQVRRTVNEGERNALYMQIQEKIYNDQPMIFLFSVSNRIITSKRFETEASGLAPGFRANDFVQAPWNRKK